MARTLTYSMPSDPRMLADWEALGLDAALNDCQDGESERNVRPDGFEVTAGESFTTLESYHAPDGRTYHILFTTDWCDQWAPWTTVHATLYDTSNPDDMVERARDIAEWEAKPETDPDYDDESED